jgi:hypothetical protein
VDLAGHDNPLVVSSIISFVRATQVELDLPRSGGAVARYADIGVDRHRAFNRPAMVLDLPCMAMVLSSVSATPPPHILEIALP